MSNSLFYVDLTTMENDQVETVRMKNKDSSSIPKTSLLPGEIMVCEVPNVLRFDPMGESKHGISGVLCATNFRVSFITAGNHANKRRSIFHSNPDLTENGDGFNNPQSQDEVLIPQACIMQICSVNGDKVKKIHPGHVFKSKLHTLVIYCKDFRVISFGFRFCPRENQRKFVNTILHYSYPPSISRLFAFDYKPHTDSEASEGRDLPTFRCPIDWTNELKRLNSLGKWRVTDANKDYIVSNCLGQFLVCPNTLRDEDIAAASIHYTSGRLPFWCWNHPLTGVPLLCSIGLSESDLMVKHQGIIFDSIKATYQGKLKPITIYDVSRNCASPRELETSFEKIKELCMHENQKDFWAADSHWLTNLDGTRWLNYIRSSLVAAHAVSKLIHVDAIPVVVRELSGRDLSLVVSSLVQLLMDPHYRTIQGFQCLIQKMWVIFGHPFAKRVSHIKVTKKDEKEEVPESPVFLHFLDCVHQLLLQFPAAFEFSDTFLLGILDCVYSCMFDTFLFDCEQDRTNISEQENRSNRLVSLWDYIVDNMPSTEFSLFLNPLYEFEHTSLVKKVPDEVCLVGSTASPCVKFWTSCFLRWLPIAKQTVGRGQSPSRHLQQMILMDELRLLRHQLAMLEANKKGVSLDTGDRSSPQERYTPLFTPSGGFRTSILNSLAGPFSFSEYSLNQFVGGKTSMYEDEV